MASLADIRAKLAQQENRANGNGGGRDNAIYPFWDISEGSTARVRFLPDGNTKNDFFWVERAMIRLPFAGVKGQMGSKPVVVQVPCMEMYGETCPILTEVRPWYKDSSLTEMANKYWKKRSYIYQGFVRDNALKDDNSPENPIRRFTISPSIQPLIITALKDPELEELPTDYDRGLDFYITKTTKGQYSDYTTSKWSRKESALTDSERAAIDAYGLFNLNDFLPKKPNDAELKVIKEMFEASVDGATYDEARWGSFYKPSGMRNGDTDAGGGDYSTSARNTSSNVTPIRAATESVEQTPPWEEGTQAASTPVSTSQPSSSQKAADILAMIKNRKTAE